MIIILQLIWILSETLNFFFVDIWLKYNLMLAETANSKWVFFLFSHLCMTFRFFQQNLVSLTWMFQKVLTSVIHIGGPYFRCISVVVFHQQFYQRNFHASSLFETQLSLSKNFEALKTKKWNEKNSLKNIEI